MIQIVIFLFVVTMILSFVVTLCAWLPEIFAVLITAFLMLRIKFEQLFSGMKSDETSKPFVRKDLKSSDFLNFKAQIKEDAKKGNYSPETALPFTVDEYKKAYKVARRKVIEKKAEIDAEVSFQYDKGERSFKPYLQGNGLTHKSEIAIYQTKFVEVRAALQQKWDKKQKKSLFQESKVKNNTDAVDSIIYQSEEEKLNDLYKDDESTDTTVTDFYKTFGQNK